MGWAIIERDADPPRLDSDYVRDEAEQVRYLEELNAVFADEGVDLAFWFTFAGYGLVHDAQPRHDLDLASYGLVRLLPGGPVPVTTGWAGNRSSRSAPWPRWAETPNRVGSTRSFWAEGGWNGVCQLTEGAQSWLTNSTAGRPHS